MLAHMSFASVDRMFVTLWTVTRPFFKLSTDNFGYPHLSRSIKVLAVMFSHVVYYRFFKVAVYYSYFLNKTLHEQFRDNIGS